MNKAMRLLPEAIKKDSQRAKLNKRVGRKLIFSNYKK